MTGVMTTVKGQTTGWEIRAAREVWRLILWLPLCGGCQVILFSLSARKSDYST